MRRRKKRKKERNKEDNEVHVDAEEEPEKEEKVHEDTCIQSTSTGKFAKIQTYAFSAEPEEKMVEFFLDKMIVFIPKRQKNTVTLPTTEKYCRSLQECWAQHSSFKKKQNNYFILQIHNIFDLR